MCDIFEVRNCVRDNFSSLGLLDFFIAHQLDCPHQLLSQGASVGLKHREPYNIILAAGISYAGSATIAVMDEVAFVNKRQDKRMEGIKEGVLGLTERVSSVEEENHQLREVNRNLEECVGREGERIRSLEDCWDAQDINQQLGGDGQVGPEQCD